MPKEWNAETYRCRSEQWRDKAVTLPLGDERNACKALADGYAHLARLIESAQTSNAWRLPIDADMTQLHMPRYRIYDLGLDDHINGVADRDCATGSEALVGAVEGLDGHPAIEFWEETRIVGRLTAERHH
jgi:hypothetical protein